MQTISVGIHINKEQSPRLLFRVESPIVFAGLADDENLDVVVDVQVEEFAPQQLEICGGMPKVAYDVAAEAIASAAQEIAQLASVQEPVAERYDHEALVARYKDVLYGTLHAPTVTAVLRLFARVFYKSSWEQYSRIDKEVYS